jgi:hypothetical protein
MYRLSDDLAKLILQKMRIPKIHTEGERKDLYTPVDYRGIGVADPLCAVGTEFDYTLECPMPIIYPELPHIPASVKGFFLYKRIELMQPMEPWLITRALIDPTTTDYEEKIDVRECSIILASDIDKLTCKTIGTLEKLIEVEPLIIDSLNLDKK